MNLDYRVVDVFTSTPLEGNPLAVFAKAEGLTGPTMQKIARELNLSETTFVLPPSRPDCDFRVRIFTPAYEMAFAGHPTIGTAYVVSRGDGAHRGARRLTLEENAGPVPVSVEGGDDPLVWLRSPPPVAGRRYDRARVAGALGLTVDDLIPGLPCRLLSTGNPGIFVALRDKSAVDSAVLNAALFAELHADEPGPVYMFLFTPVNRGAYARMFAPDLGIAEDPATGGAAAPLAHFMMEHGLAPHADGSSFVSEQGVKMGRRSLLHIRIEGDYGARGTYIGGHVTPIARATMALDMPA